MFRDYYFGCRGAQAGHCIYGASSDTDKLDDGFPVWLLDGTFAPIDRNDRGWKLTHLSRTHLVLSILAKHDNTIDKRPGSNACFVIIDSKPWDEASILAHAKKRFPDCWDRLVAP